jgi:hypothetical protein
MSHALQNDLQAHSYPAIQQAAFAARVRSKPSTTFTFPVQSAAQSHWETAASELTLLLMVSSTGSFLGPIKPITRVQE